MINIFWILKALVVFSEYCQNYHEILLTPSLKILWLHSVAAVAASGLHVEVELEVGRGGEDHQRGDRHRQEEDQKQQPVWGATVHLTAASAFYIFDLIPIICSFLIHGLFAVVLCFFSNKVQKQLPAAQRPWFLLKDNSAPTIDWEKSCGLGFLNFDINTADKYKIFGKQKRQ